MSSFNKTIVTAVSMKRTKVKNNCRIVSSGIPSLDHIIGGGLPAGRIFIVGLLRPSVSSILERVNKAGLAGSYQIWIYREGNPNSEEEDVLANYSRVLSKYFLAEGIVCQHALFIASADDDPKDIVNELPIPCTAPPEDEIPSATAGVDKMKIAWRYEGLGQVDSSFGSTSNFGHHFDLSKHVDAETIKSSDITFWSPSDNLDTNKSSFNNKLYQDLLVSIKKIVSKEEHENSAETNNNMLRISIHSLGSPTWTADDSGDDTMNYGQDLIKFMYCLRVLLRDTNAVAYITMPTHLFDDSSLFKRLLYSVDNAVRLESFAGSSRETNPVYKDYHGLFHITKLAAINSLAQFVPPSLDMAFKLRRKKFIIEKLHLPPELQDSSEREQDDITATPTVACGGFKKKDIDF